MAANVRAPTRTFVPAAEAASAIIWALVAAVAARLAALNDCIALTAACHFAASIDFPAAAASALPIRTRLAAVRFAAELATPNAAHNCSVPTSVGIARLR